MWLNGTGFEWAITIVWTELFGAMRAPYNRHHELCPNKLKNKLFDQNFDLFMVKTWSNFGQKKVILTINSQQLFQKIFFFGLSESGS